MDKALLQKLAEQFGLALDWGNENIIPYLQQLAERVVKYEIGQSIFWLVIGVIFLILGVTFIVLGVKKFDDWLEEASILFVAFGIFFIIIAGCVICQQINDLILCKYLPEKILLRYVNTK